MNTSRLKAEHQTGLQQWCVSVHSCGLSQSPAGAAVVRARFFFFTALLLQRQIKVRQSGGMEIASAQYIKKGFIETVLSDTDANLATFEHLNKRFSGLITPYVTRRDESWHLTGDGRGTAAA